MSCLSLPLWGTSASPLAQRRPFRPGLHALRRALVTSLPLAAADIAALTLAFVICASVIRLVGRCGGSGDLAALMLPVTSALVMSFAIIGLYPGVGLNPIVELRQTSCGTTVVFCVLLAAMQFNHAVFASAKWLLIAAWPLALVAIPLARAAVRRLCSRGSWWGHRAVVFGDGQAGLAAFAHLESRPWLGLRPVGIVTDARDDARHAGCPVSFRIARHRTDARPARRGVLGDSCDARPTARRSLARDRTTRRRRFPIF